MLRLCFPEYGADLIVRENREEREFHPESAAKALLAGHFDFAIMGSTDCFDDGETESGSAAGAGAGLIGAIKSFEHVGQSVHRDAKAVVGDFEHRAIPLAANMDLDH